jgi:endoglucanase
MKTLALVLLFLTLPAAAAFAADSSAEPAAPPKPWWQGGRWHPPAPDPKAGVLPRISVKGNHFVNPAGETVRFRGLAIADPDKLAGQDHWGRDLFAAVKDMGANLVRIPVHPIAWRERTPAKYLELLDQAVDWCTDLGLYVIIDWHSIGNLETGMFQAPMYDTSYAETLNFWRTIALHFRGHHTVAFFELFNEPADWRGMLGTFDWSRWREMNEEMIRVIRACGAEAIPLVAGGDWAYDLDPVRYDPVRAEGIGYAVHPYPSKRSQPWEPKWEVDFAFAAARYPVLATELGFTLKGGETDNADRYGERITRFLEERGIGWVAWDFDPNWGPTLLKSFDGFQLTPAGEFFKAALHRPPAPPLEKAKD